MRAGKRSTGFLLRMNISPGWEFRGGYAMMWGVARGNLLRPALRMCENPDQPTSFVVFWLGVFFSIFEKKKQKRKGTP